MKKNALRSVQKVGLATTDWSRSIRDLRGFPIAGGANWIRFGQMSDRMRNHLVFGLLKKTSNGLGVQSFDNSIHPVQILVLQRWMDDWVLEEIPKAKQNGTIIINDIDDWFWGLHSENTAKNVVDPKLNKKSNTSIYKEILQLSDLVVTSTPFLHKKLLKWNKNTVLIENCVLYELFKRKKHNNVAPTVGWCGSTAHRSGDLEILKEPFRSLPRNWKFHHTGHLESHPSFAKKTGITPTRFSTTPMLAPFDYPTGFSSFDIGVVPLTDIPFNNAKSWIKGLEYAAAGIPFIASPSDEYVRLSETYGIGRIASTPEEWLNHLDDLSDYRVREKESIFNRQVIKECFGVEKMARTWDEIIWGFS